MDQDTLKALLKEAIAEVVEEKLQVLLELDRWNFLQEHDGRANGHYAHKRSTNLIERLFRQQRRSTKVRHYEFPKLESVYKLVYLETERREGMWERKLPGFADVQEEIHALFNTRYPATQTLTQKT